ncbi:O-methyltransferase [Endozoicomonas elysicola]|uniref:Methyltransferase n=1 Tax=Endozoicomonas elysicola TaxID=305900 RepID=A0A081KDJ0_9GAMM|nr:class I SAM-dependent methyltransferase [Endozoicomonas elysicola]KEI72216.1 methyltransferase [Endozoicomonas elysicola]
MDLMVDPAIENYCQEMTSGESQILAELAQATVDRTRYPVNLSGRLVGQTLKMLVQISRSKTVLEIGMFTGYAALSMAEGLPVDGVVYACETNPRSIDIGQEFFDRSPHGHKINVLFGRALDTIPEIREKLDLVFIDADKKKYREYVDLVLPMLSPQGLVVIDDALWKGKVLDPQEERDQVIADLNRYIYEHPNLESVLLPIRHGLNIVRKV